MSFSSTVKMTSGTTFTPHPYQSDAITWVVEKEAAGLFLPPGMGKTASILSAFKQLKAAGKVKKLLVIAPIRVCHLVWPLEITKWGNFNDLTVSVLHGPHKNKAALADTDIYCANPDGMKWLFKTLGNKFDSSWMLVVDESSQFKNFSSQRFKLLKANLDKFGRRVIMTGTPAPNGLENIWSQVYILDRGSRLGRYITHYRVTYFFPSGYMGYQQTLIPGSDTKIYAKISDIVMHKSRSELNMPELMTNNIPVALDSDARSVYNDMKRHLLAELEDGTEAVAVNGAVMAGKLKQIANGALYREDRSIVEIHKEKITAVEDLVDSLEGSPLLVFYEYNHDLERLKKAFPNAPVFGGQTSAKEAEKNLAAWNRGEIPIMFLHPASAGHGLNMQSGGCTDVCFFSITWDQELHEQAIARVWRQGVSSAVTVHYIVAQNTIDERILNVLHDKATLQSALLDALKK